MNEKARSWRLLIGAAAAGIAGVVGLAGATASADPVLPQPQPPAPALALATVTQTVTVMPTAAINPVASTATQPGAAALSQPGATATQPGAAALSQPLATPAAAPVTLVPATSETLTDYFKDKGVALEPQTAQDFKALNIVLPMPPGWTQVPDPNVPNAFVVTADRAGGDGLYTSNAQVTVSKLVGDFDPKDAITHGYIDSQQLSGWQSTDASLADFSGFPSSIIEGTYRADDQTLNTSRRHIIAASGPDNYLVTLAVTTSLDEVVATASATDIIINGFKVVAAGPTTP